MTATMEEYRDGLDAQQRKLINQKRDKENPQSKQARDTLTAGKARSRLDGQRAESKKAKAIHNLSKHLVGSDYNLL